MRVRRPFCSRRVGGAQTCAYFGWYVAGKYHRKTSWLARAPNSLKQAASRFCNENSTLGWDIARKRSALVRVNCYDIFEGRIGNFFSTQLIEVWPTFDVWRQG